MTSAKSSDIQVLGKLDEKGPNAMISAKSFDIQVLDKMDEGKYFIVLKIGEDKEIESEEALPRKLGPGWKAEHSFVLTFGISQFYVWSEINMEIFHKSPKLWSRKHSVAKYTGLGIDLLANDHQLVIEPVDKGPRISIELDLDAVEGHVQLMRALDEDMGRLTKLKGADAVQTVITFGAVLNNIVPIVDKFTGSHPVLNAAWIVLSSAYKVRG
ncbi:hypothetical protein FIBSPDRAFT_900962 [Athelia psychrophila]|uniref:Uncharacterized protein n=1 Tax=Athelia psychrophila TaxID=1759441 RepID=A0A165XR18_9AGAM|nr:hypothetical protein FIBSPDRAFT_900962 [Fibularhizoctonia sp. CBS 109695]